jgi:hypothetical protein
MEGAQYFHASFVRTLSFARSELYFVEAANQGSKAFHWCQDLGPRPIDIGGEGRPDVRELDRPATARNLHALASSLDSSAIRRVRSGKYSILAISA